ncbi:MAG: ATP-binding protein [Mariprofundaceae bacterium]
MRLFWKLLLILLAAMLLAAVAANWIGRQWLAQDQAIESRLVALVQSGEIAASLYRNEGPETCRRWLRRQMRTRHFSGFLLDALGRPLFRRSMPPELARIAERLMRERKPLRRLDPPHLVVALPLDDEKLPMYWLAASRLPPKLMRRSGATQAGIRIGLALLALLLVSALLARMLTRPMAGLANAAQRLGNGELGTRPPAALTARRDELGQLARSFAGMAERIESLVESHKTLLRDVSHELRSPLTRLGVALEIARTRLARGEDAAAELDRIGIEAERLNALIEEVLTLARLDQAALPLREETVDIPALLAHLAEDLAFEAEAQHKRIALDTRDALIVRGDPEWLRRALENVARNAIRHAVQRIGISARARDDRLEIRIQDDGPGAPEQTLAHLFDPFFRASSARERDSGSHGLGLAIARQVVRAHRGTIDATNHPDGGLLVRIRLPLAGGKARRDHHASRESSSQTSINGK